MRKALDSESHIHFHSLHPDFQLDNSSQIAQWLLDVTTRESREIEVLNYIFCTDDYLLEINIKHLNHNYLTDIITFPYSEGKRLESDIFISIDRVEENSKTFKSSPFDELCRVLVHGLLHLCGYRDKSDAEKEEMRSKEDYYLSLRSF
jgi:rRNA maturation RNase YbeY